MRKTLKWVPYTGSIFLLALSLLLLFAPGIVTTVFPPLLGTVMIIAGAWGIGSFVVLKDRMREPGLKLVQNLVTLTVGVIFLLKRDVSLAFLAILFGMYALVSAIIGISDALQCRGDKRAFRGELTQGVFSFILGALLLFAPFSERDLWARFLGAYFLVAAAHGFYWTWKITGRVVVEEQEQTADTKE